MADEKREPEHAGGGKKRSFLFLDKKGLSNLAVVLIGISFYAALTHFSGIKRQLGSLIGVLTPFIVGFFIAYLLNTPIDFFADKVYRKLKARRGLAVLTVYLLALFVLALLLNFIVPQVMDSFMTLVGNMSTYMNNLNVLVRSLTEMLHIEGDGVAHLVLSYEDIMRQVTGFITEKVPELLSLGMAVGSGVISGVTALIASIYMLLGKEHMLPQLRKLTYAVIPVGKADRFFTICRRANGIFVGFINGKLIDSAIIGVLCFVLNLIFRIPYNILIATVIGVTNIIPFFGPIIGAVPCIMILLIVDPWAALRFGILVIALQQFDGNILGPKILGDSTGLSPMWVLVAIVVGGGLFGFPGMVLGVPVFAVLYSLTREWVNGRLERKGITDTATAAARAPEGKDDAQ